MYCEEAILMLEMIISPWGEVLVKLGGESNEEPEIATAEIDLNLVKRVGMEMPLLRRMYDLSAGVD